MSTLPDPLIGVRLDARHGLPPMAAGALRAFCHQNVTTAGAVRAAESLGRQDRADGVRCMCSYCEGASHDIGGRERLRQHYAARRHAELTAQGLGLAERTRFIEEEINLGAAFQAGPVAVTRTGGTKK